MSAKITSGPLIVLCLGFSLTLAACASPPGSGRLESGPPAYMAYGQAVRSAWPAIDAKNYAEALRWCREIDALPEVKVAFAGTPFTGPYSDGRYYHKATVDLADDYSTGQARARVTIGNLYENGTIVSKDYAQAAMWHQKSANTRDLNGQPNLFSAVAAQNLGILYAYGLGVPRDRERARQLWAEGSSESPMLVRLLASGTLPKSAEDRSVFWQQVRAESAAIQGKEQRQRQAEAQAEQDRLDREIRRSVSEPRRDSGVHSHAPKNNCSALDWAFAPRNALGGMYLGGGCN